MGKTLVMVKIAALEETYDIWIPEVSSIYDVRMLIGAAVEGMMEGKYRADREAILCNMETGDIYNSCDTVAASGIKNGDFLILI